MIGDYFYNKTIRKTVAVFGSLFNDIVVRRQSGDKILNTIKVPLAYGPIEKFLARSLNVMARTQDDALQIIEQILPTFAPEYTVTVKEFEGPGSKTDVPIILTGTSFSNEYEGDFANTRQLIVYTMTFSVKIKFSGKVEDKKIINDVDIDLFNYTGSLTDSDSDGFLEEISVTADSDSGPITTLILDSDDGI